MIWKMGIVGKIAENGYNKTTFSRVLGVSRATLNKKLDGKVEFTATEIQKIANILNIENKDHYFFL